MIIVGYYAAGCTAEKFGAPCTARRTLDLSLSELQVMCSLRDRRAPQPGREAKTACNELQIWLHGLQSS